MDGEHIHMWAIYIHLSTKKAQHHLPENSYLPLPLVPKSSGLNAKCAWHLEHRTYVSGSGRLLPYSAWCSLLSWTLVVGDSSIEDATDKRLVRQLDNPMGDEKLDTVEAITKANDTNNTALNLHPLFPSIVLNFILVILYSLQKFQSMYQSANP